MTGDGAGHDDGDVSAGAGGSGSHGPDADLADDRARGADTHIVLAAGPDPGGGGSGSAARDGAGGGDRHGADADGLRVDPALVRARALDLSGGADAHRCGGALGVDAMAAAAGAGGARHLPSADRERAAALMGLDAVTAAGRLSAREAAAASRSDLDLHRAAGARGLDPVPSLAADRAGRGDVERAAGSHVDGADPVAAGGDPGGRNRQFLRGALDVPRIDSVAVADDVTLAGDVDAGAHRDGRARSGVGGVDRGVVDCVVGLVRVHFAADFDLEGSRGVRRLDAPAARLDAGVAVDLDGHASAVGLVVGANAVPGGGDRPARVHGDLAAAAEVLDLDSVHVLRALHVVAVEVACSDGAVCIDRNLAATAVFRVDSDSAAAGDGARADGEIAAAGALRLDPDRLAGDGCGVHSDCARALRVKALRAALHDARRRDGGGAGSAVLCEDARRAALDRSGPNGDVAFGAAVDGVDPVLVGACSAHGSAGRDPRVSAAVVVRLDPVPAGADDGDRAAHADDQVAVAGALRMDAALHARDGCGAHGEVAAARRVEALVAPAGHGARRRDGGGASSLVRCVDARRAAFDRSGIDDEGAVSVAVGGPDSVLVGAYSSHGSAGRDFRVSAAAVVRLDPVSAGAGAGGSDPVHADDEVAVAAASGLDSASPAGDVRAARIHEDGAAALREDAVLGHACHRARRADADGAASAGCGPDAGPAAQDRRRRDVDGAAAVAVDGPDSVTLGNVVGFGAGDLDGAGSGDRDAAAATVVRFDPVCSDVGGGDAAGDVDIDLGRTDGDRAAAVAVGRDSARPAQDFGDVYGDGAAALCEDALPGFARHRAGGPDGDGAGSAADCPDAGGGALNRSHRDGDAAGARVGDDDSAAASAASPDEAGGGDRGVPAAACARMDPVPARAGDGVRADGGGAACAAGVDPAAPAMDAAGDDRIGRACNDRNGAARAGRVDPVSGRADDRARCADGNPAASGIARMYARLGAAHGGGGHADGAGAGGAGDGGADAGAATSVDRAGGPDQNAAVGVVRMDAGSGLGRRSVCRDGARADGHRPGPGVDGVDSVTAAADLGAARDLGALEGVADAGSHDDPQRGSRPARPDAVRGSAVHRASRADGDRAGSPANGADSESALRRHRRCGDGQVRAGGAGLRMDAAEGARSRHSHRSAGGNRDAAGAAADGPYAVAAASRRRCRDGDVAVLRNRMDGVVAGPDGVLARGNVGGAGAAQDRDAEIAAAGVGRHAAIAAVHACGRADRHAAGGGGVAGQDSRRVGAGAEALDGAGGGDRDRAASPSRVDSGRGAVDAPARVGVGAVLGQDDAALRDVFEHERRPAAADLAAFVGSVSLSGVDRHLSIEGDAQGLRRRVCAEPLRFGHVTDDAQYVVVLAEAVEVIVLRDIELVSDDTDREVLPALVFAAKRLEDLETVLIMTRGCVVHETRERHRGANLLADDRQVYVGRADNVVICIIVIPIPFDVENVRQVVGKIDVDRDDPEVAQDLAHVDGPGGVVREAQHAGRGRVVRIGPIVFRLIGIVVGGRVEVVPVDAEIHRGAGGVAADLPAHQEPAAYCAILIGFAIGRPARACACPDFQRIDSDRARDAGEAPGLDLHLVGSRSGRHDSVELPARFHRHMGVGVASRDDRIASDSDLGAVSERDRAVLAGDGMGLDRRIGRSGGCGHAPANLERDVAPGGACDDAGLVADDRPAGFVVEREVDVAGSRLRQVDRVAECRVDRRGRLEVHVESRGAGGAEILLDVHRLGAVERAGDAAARLAHHRGELQLEDFPLGVEGQLVRERVDHERRRIHIARHRHQVDDGAVAVVGAPDVADLDRDRAARVAQHVAVDHELVGPPAQPLARPGELHVEHEHRGCSCSPEVESAKRDVAHDRFAKIAPPGVAEVERRTRSHLQRARRVGDAVEIEVADERHVGAGADLGRVESRHGGLASIEVREEPHRVHPGAAVEQPLEAAAAELHIVDAVAKRHRSGNRCACEDIGLGESGVVLDREFARFADRRAAVQGDLGDLQPAALGLDRRRADAGSASHAARDVDARHIVVRHFGVDSAAAGGGNIGIRNDANVTGVVVGVDAGGAPPDRARGGDADDSAAIVMRPDGAAPRRRHARRRDLDSVGAAAAPREDGGCRAPRGRVRHRIRRIDGDLADPLLSVDVDPAGSLRDVDSYGSGSGLFDDDAGGHRVQADGADQIDAHGSRTRMLDLHRLFGAEDVSGVDRHVSVRVLVHKNAVSGGCADGAGRRRRDGDVAARGGVHQDPLARGNPLHGDVDAAGASQEGCVDAGGGGCGDVAADIHAHPSGGRGDEDPVIGGGGARGGDVAADVDPHAVSPGAPRQDSGAARNRLRGGDRHGAGAGGEDRVDAHAVCGGSGDGPGDDKADVAAACARADRRFRARDVAWCDAIRLTRLGEDDSAGLGVEHEGVADPGIDERRVVHAHVEGGGAGGAHRLRREVFDPALEHAASGAGLLAARRVVSQDDLARREADVEAGRSFAGYVEGVVLVEVRGCDVENLDLGAVDDGAGSRNVDAGPPDEA